MEVKHASRLDYIHSGGGLGASNSRWFGRTDSGRNTDRHIPDRHSYRRNSKIVRLPHTIPVSKEQSMNSQFSRSMANSNLAGILALLTMGGAATAQDQPPAATPQHEVLKQDVGAWDATMKVWPNPGAEPAISHAKETNELLPGGLWLVSRFEGEIAGMPFTGVGTTGYDPDERRYVGTWADTMSPHLMVMHGDYDAATKTMTGSAEVRSPETGQMVTLKEVGKYIDDDSRVFEMQMPNKDGKYWKFMEIEYKRHVD
jgi:hypothetical protein